MRCTLDKHKALCHCVIVSLFVACVTEVTQFLKNKININFKNSINIYSISSKKKLKYLYVHDIKHLMLTTPIEGYSVDHPSIEYVRFNLH